MHERCEKNLHDYRALGSDSRVKAEQCVLCGKKKFFNKDKNGRIDEKEYAKAHRADFLQPFGSTEKEFNQVYGGL